MKLFALLIGSVSATACPNGNCAPLSAFLDSKWDSLSSYILLASSLILVVALSTVLYQSVCRAKTEDEYYQELFGSNT